MFAGHYAASVVAKTVAPRLPLWVCVGAAQLLDIGWAGLVWAGIEKLRVVPDLAGSPLDLYHMPWTHSLAAAALWSVMAGALATLQWGRAGWWIGAVVFSHWLADLLVHRPDLALWPGGEARLGLGLWNLPILEMIVEIGLLGVTVTIWAAGRIRGGLLVRPAIGWFMAILILAAINAVPGEPPSPAGMAALALMAYMVAIAIGGMVDRSDRSASGSGR